MHKELVVIKVGTNVMTNKDNRIVRPFLHNLVHQIAELYERDIMSILVSSGSVIAGKEVLGKSKISNKAQRRQVYSAIGQPRVMRLYYNMFHDYGMKCAQVLPTKRDFNPGIHRENMISCIEGLLSEGVIPIANEDDAVSVKNSMFSDNDELAMLIAQLTNADKFILMTDIDGLFNGHPDHEDSRVIKEVSPDEELNTYIQENHKQEGEGRGGMRTKLGYAQKAAARDITSFIVNGKKENILIDLIEGKKVGTKISH